MRATRSGTGVDEHGFNESKDSINKEREFMTQVSLSETRTLQLYQGLSFLDQSIC